MKPSMHFDTAVLLLCLPASVRQLATKRIDRERIGSLLRTLEARGVVKVVDLEPRPGGKGGPPAYVYDLTKDGAETVREICASRKETA